MAAADHHKARLRLRRGLARHARPAGRQGRERRRDDARARRRARARRASRSPPRPASPTWTPAGTEPDGPRGAGGRGPGAAGGAGRASAWATPADPLLVSVRSGARESMPGMLDTVLNLGLERRRRWRGSRARPATSASPGTPTGASCRCSGTSAAASPGERFEDGDQGAQGGGRREARHRARRWTTCRALAATFKELYREQTGEDFPQDPREQLRQAIRAVFDSWMGERAVEYRRINRIPDDWGTAVNVQQMVFGNKGDTLVLRASPSRATRSPARPSRRATSSPNAQGEDVVSGVRTPRDLAELKDAMPEAHAELLEILRDARAPLRRHAGHGVHRGGGPPLHAPDPQRQAARRRPRCASRSMPWRRACSTRDEALRDDRRRRARRAAAPGLRRATPTTTCSPRAWPPRPGAAKGAIVFTRRRRRGGRRGRPRRDPRAPVHGGRRRGRLPRRARASSPRRAARPATPRSWRAGWASRACAGASALEIDLTAQEVRVNGTRARARAT